MESKTLGGIVFGGICLAFLWPLLIPGVFVFFVCLPFVIFYLALPIQPKGNPQRSIPVGPNRKDGGRPRRHARFPDRLVYSMVEGAETFPDIFRGSVAKFGDRACMGTRRTLRTIHKEITIHRGDEEVKKTVSIPIKADFEWKTYQEIGDTVTTFGSSLNHIGLKQGDHVAIFLDTCPEWQVCSLSCMERGITVVTVYASLGHEALVYALNLAKVNAVFTSSKLVTQILDAKVPSVSSIIHVGSVEEEKSKEFEADEGPDLYSYNEMLEKGNVEIPVEAEIRNKDVAAIMFTSGSTGNPKGVLISHENILAGCAGIYHGTGDAVDESEKYIAFLPLAHILEFCAEAAVLTIGGRIGYGSPHTLQGQSCFDENEKPAGDITTLKPTCMPAVPLILDRIRKGAYKAAMSKGFVIGNLFKIMYFLKRRRYLQGLPSPICDSIVFNTFVSNLGGDLKFLVSGGSPLSADTQEFMNIVFNAPIGQGYGLTETTGNGTFTDVTDVTTGRVGPPVPSCEIRLVDCPEMNYTSADAPYPRGEICLRGPVVTEGYLNMTEDQAKSFEKDPDGQGVWFHTGDIGMWREDGSLEIIDRMKDLVKLSGGEYIALGHLEAIYGDSEYVDNICINANSFKTNPVALIVANKYAIFQLGKRLEIKGSVEQLLERREIKREVLSDLGKMAKRAKLKNFEKIGKVKLIADRWTPKNGLLTEAEKLKRNVVNKKYESDFEELYA